MEDPRAEPHHTPERQPIDDPRRPNGAMNSVSPDSHQHHHLYRKHYDGELQIPSHVYDRYHDHMDHDHRDGRPGSHQQGQHPPHVSVDMDHISTLYIPKSDGGKTLIRRRRNSSKRRSSSRRSSSKRRSSSRRQQQRENLDDMMLEEDNHLLPSLRIQRRARTKTMKERHQDLEEEKRLDMIDGPDEKSFKQRYQDLKDRDEVRPGNFAELLRSSTLKKMRKLTEWKQPKKLERFNRRSREFFSQFKLWMTAFKVIEGKFGTAVMSFFMFIRWLMFLNLFLTLVMICVITIPYVALGSESFDETMNSDLTVFHNKSIDCSLNYTEYSKELLKKENTFENVLDFLQGTGWMERTVLFYGKYHNKTRTVDGELYTYNMGLAYLLAIGTCFLVSFILIVRNSAKTVKSTFGMERSVAAYTNRVFSGWDYAITNKKAAKVKSANLYTEYKACLDEELQKKRRENRSTNDQATIFFIRVLVNCFVLALLSGCLFLVYFTTDKLLELQKQHLNEIVALIVQYLPYLTITVMNFIIPIIFQKIVVLEDYLQNNALRITLGRSILLRLASLGVLFISLYRLLITNGGSNVTCGNQLWDRTNSTVRGSIKCWETYVGQQIYKLVLLDLIVEAGIIVFIQLPRRLLYDRFGQTVVIIKKIGPQDFDLPQNVIDIIYSQTLCWLGMFFSPLIPLMTFVKCFLFFYLRKWTLLKNCAQTEQTYRTSRSHALFMFVLLISFILATIPVGYMVSSISPSQSCGPFRVYSKEDYTMFASLSNTIQMWPATLKAIVFFLGSVGFLIPAIIILGLLMYSFWLLGQGYKKREKILSDQLKMVSKDKQFLLARVNEVLAYTET